jgi:D-psicose/D-tagatose/L-ribulose 3-epimerase
MRIGVSSIAWRFEDDPWVAEQLLAREITAIDVTPFKAAGEGLIANARQLYNVRKWWADYGITITGMQALFYGVSAPSLFKDDEARAELLVYLNRVASIAEELGVTRLVFGSPRQRDRMILDEAKAFEIALRFFTEVGELMARKNVVLCLEPVPRSLNCNFIVSVSEAIRMISAIDHPSVQLNLDLGAITSGSETLREALNLDTVNKVGHIHLSEPGLRPLGQGKTNHSKLASLLNKFFPDRLAVIEVLPVNGEKVENWLPSVLDFALATYGQSKG